MKDDTKAQLKKLNEQLQREIEERRRAEEALRESEEKYRTIFNEARDGMVLIDRETGLITDCNPEFERQTGRQLKQLKTMKIWQIRPSEKQEAARGKFLKIKGTGEGGSTELEFGKPDGEIVPIEFVTRAVRLEDKKYLLSISRDVSERRRTERELEEREKRYRILAENVTDVILATDLNLRPTYASPSVTRLLGYTVAESMNRTIEESLVPASLEVAAEALAEQLMGMAEDEKGRRPRRPPLELEFYRKDSSTVWVETTVSFLRNPEGQPVEIVTVLRDITERKQAEERLQELLAQEQNLRQNLEEEMKNRVEFTRALVHELKTPLTAIMASSDLLAEELSEGPMTRLAGNINQSAARLNTRIDQLLDLARGEIGMLDLSLRPLNPLEMLRGAADDMASVASGREQSLIVDLPPSLPQIVGDEERLRQVVSNLLNNACKYTPEGGKITLRAAATDDSLTVEVHDTGRGISKEDQKRVFELYYRGHGEGERIIGLGIGLALSKTLVDLHGGTMWVRSQEGKGSTFAFSVPLEASSQIPPAKTRNDKNPHD